MTLTRALVTAGVVGLAGGLLLGWLLHGDRADPPASAEIGVEVGDRRPAFRHAGIDGRFWRARDFDGAPVLINFWATWCAPCVREMPLLDAVNKERGDRLRVVGIAIDEPGAAARFAERLGIDYPVLIGTDDVRETLARYGNAGGMLPYSVLVDAAGIVRWTHLGELERSMLEDALSELP